MFNQFYKNTRVSFCSRRRRRRRKRRMRRRRRRRKKALSLFLKVGSSWDNWISPGKGIP